MERATLHATKRQTFGTRAAQRSRNEGLVPIVLYGHGRDAVHLTVPLDAIAAALHSGYAYKMSTFNSSRAASPYSFFAKRHSPI